MGPYAFMRNCEITISRDQLSGNVIGLTPAVPYSYFLPSGIGYGLTASVILEARSSVMKTLGFGALKTDSPGLPENWTAL